LPGLKLARDELPPGKADAAPRQDGVQIDHKVVDPVARPWIGRAQPLQGKEVRPVADMGWFMEYQQRALQ